MSGGRVVIHIKGWEILRLGMEQFVLFFFEIISIRDYSFGE